MTETTKPEPMPVAVPLATRSGLLGFSGKRIYRTVETPAGPVRLRSLMGDEAFECDNYIYDSKGNLDRSRERYQRAKRFVESIVDENGNKLFTDFDLPTLASWPEPLQNAIGTEIFRLSKPDALGEFAKNE